MKNQKTAKKLLVIIPHSGIKRPPEIKKAWLTEFQERFLYTETAETDRGTDKLYDFRKYLGNQQILFPFSQAYVNICRKNAEEGVPLVIAGYPVYKKAPTKKFRNELFQKYSVSVFKKINAINKTLIFNGHATISGHSSLGDEVLDDHIIISNYFYTKGRKIYFCPDEYAEFYKCELQKRLPELKIGRNSAYLNVYDQICAKFGWNGKRMMKKRVPVIHQETDESLYIENNRINLRKLNRLNKIFADALLATMEYFRIL